MPAVVLAVPGDHAGIERQRPAGGQGRRPAPEAMVMNCRALRVVERRVPGHEFALDRVGAAALGRGEEPALGAEDVQVELLQRRLRQVLEGDRDPAGLRVGLDRAGSFTWVAKPSAVRITRYGSPGFGSPR